MTFMDFFALCIKHSVLALTRGCKGVIFLCLKPVWWAYVLNSWLLNGWPLSVFNDLGIPNYAKISSSHGITQAYTFHLGVAQRLC